ncbi:MAG: hypothetical protein PHG29_08455 [Prolixibacteraceae bacterium]|nr:hypothetical protein [Prolixibacteraceae bacterium]
MRDLNIPRVDEVQSVPDVSAGAGLFPTDVNSQDALSYGAGANQTAVDPTKANANPTIDPAFLAYLMESQKNVAPSNTTLPPNYYYPDANRGVTVGQMSGPLGSMSLITPGAPLFPMSVMDAVQKEDEANKQKWLEEQLKPIKPEKYTVPLLKNTAWNNRWVKWANKKYDDPTREYLDKYDDAAMARIMLERDGVFQKASDDINAWKSVIDDAEIHAEDILKQDPTKGFYRAPAVIEAAEEWRATVEALDFDDPKSWEKVVKAKNKMYMAEALDTSTKPILDGINQSILMDGIFEQAYSKSVGADGKVNMTALKTNVDQAYITFKKTGLNACPDIDAKINAMYEAKYPTESPSNPTLEVFKNFIISSAKVGVEEQFQKMTTDNVWERLAAQKKTDEKVLTPNKTKFNFGAFTTYGYVYAAPNTKSATFASSVSGKAFNPTTGLFDAEGYVDGGSIVAKTFIYNPQTKKYVKAYYVTPSQTATITDKDGNRMETTTYKGNKVYLMESTNGLDQTWDYMKGEENVRYEPIEKAEGYESGDTYVTEEDYVSSSGDSDNPKPAPARPLPNAY